MSPEALLYATTHEWVRIDDSGEGRVAVVGVSAFAVEQLTDVVHLELPQAGRQVTAGEAMGEIESVKAVSDLYSPVKGEVVAVNDGLPDNLEQLNTDPYGDGWMVKIRLDDAETLDHLLDHAAYQQQCEAEG